MLRIGEFSTLTRLSARMLRYYDANGVLTPAAT
ncbi:MAG: MerR family DNA-binding transcriptional regulator, partial [Tannerella sp.]